MGRLSGLNISTVHSERISGLLSKNLTSTTQEKNAQSSSGRGVLIPLRSGQDECQFSKLETVGNRTDTAFCARAMR